MQIQEIDGEMILSVPNKTPQDHREFKETTLQYCLNPETLKFESRRVVQNNRTTGMYFQAGDFFVKHPEQERQKIEFLGNIA